MRVVIIGTGYVGLVAGACFAELGHDVCCVDVDEDTIHRLQRGEVPLSEPGLTALVSEGVASGRLSFSTGLEAASQAQAVFIAVGTPGGEGDVAAVLEVGRALQSLLPQGAVVVQKSTVPVGTTERLAKVLAGHDVVAVPEFLREGQALQDFRGAGRVVFGTASARAVEVLSALYGPLLSGRPPVVVDGRSAELSKFAANAMLAARVSFINDVARLSDALGADVEAVRRVLGGDPRLGPDYLEPGIGFGGGCLPKDLAALIRQGTEAGVALPLLEGVQHTNALAPRWLVERAQAHFGSLSGRVVAVWGLAFKPGTDDVRASPALAVVELLLAAGAVVRAVDPAAGPKALAALRGRISVVDDALEAATGAEALFLLTAWDVFLGVDFAQLKACMQSAVVFDGRNAFPYQVLRGLGFTCYATGRP